MSASGETVRAVRARNAASLIVWREGVGGTEVLMGVRGAGHRFMPNRLVFPGGAVDAADRTAAAATEPDPALLRALGVRQRRVARAVAMAAARELQEETGASLGVPPRLDVLAYLCRAVTPRSSPIRFNARFLVAPATVLEGAPRDSEELSAVRFYPVAEVLELPGVVIVTAEVLRRFQDWLAGPAAVREQRHVFREKRWRPDTL